MTKKIGKVVTLFVTVAVIFAGCATVKFEAQRTPTLDTTGIQRIAIMPFEASNPTYQSAANYATSAVTSKIQATNHFTLVNPQTIQDLRRQNQSIESHVDALFTGQITQISVDQTQKQGQRTDRTTAVTTTYTTYTRVVEVQFNYGFTRARDGSLIGPITKKGRRSSSAEDDQSKVASADTLVREAIDEQIYFLARDVAPYTITLSRSLEKESSKALQPQMKDIEKLVTKDKSYRAALEAYLKIYNENKNIAAAINASILYEAVGETQAAATFMQGVYTASGNPKAKATLDRLNRELQEMAGAAAYDDDRSPAEKVADYAKDEIQKVLPATAKLWIQNNTTSDQALANEVIDNLSAALLRGGVSLVDRESIALIMRERNFQTSGEVSDSDMVSIGNMAGANTVAVINITGTGAQRRLQVRVLDIEKGVPLFLSDTSDNWKL